MTNNFLVLEPYQHSKKRAGITSISSLSRGSPVWGSPIQLKLPKEFIINSKFLIGYSQCISSGHHFQVSDASRDRASRFPEPDIHYLGLWNNTIPSVIKPDQAGPQLPATVSNLPMNNNQTITVTIRLPHSRSQNPFLHPFKFR